MTEYKYDCLSWDGYMPCTNIKQGKTQGCFECPFYSPISNNYLIVEAGGLGSVLRTSAVSKTLKLQEPNCQVQWLTHTEGVEVLNHVPSVDKVLDSSDPKSIAILNTQVFDASFNFESDPYHLAIATTVPSHKRFGFVSNRLGKLKIREDISEPLLRLQVDDPFRKRENAKSMQQLMVESCGLIWTGQGYDLRVNDEAEIWASDLVKGEYVGLNIGSSLKHDAKRWKPEYFHALAKISPEINFLVLAGLEDQEAYRTLQSFDELPNLTFRGYEQSISQFISLVGRMKTVISADTFALHIALALGVPTVSLHGVMPAQEILGNSKIDLGLECSPCFASRVGRCRNQVKLACMDISPSLVKSQLC